LGGQVFLGIDIRNAVAITAFAELVTCSATVTLYFLAKYAANLIIPLLIGAIISAPLAAYTVNHIGKRKLKRATALIMIVFGIMSFINTIIFTR